MNKSLQDFIQDFHLDKLGYDSSLIKKEKWADLEKKYNDFKRYGLIDIPKMNSLPDILEDGNEQGEEKFLRMAKNFDNFMLDVSYQIPHRTYMIIQDVMKAVEAEKSR